MYRCSTRKLAFALDVSPFSIPRLLYNMQNAEVQEITYEMD